MKTIAWEQFCAVCNFNCVFHQYGMVDPDTTICLNPDMVEIKQFKKNEEHCTIWKTFPDAIGIQGTQGTQS